MRSKLLFKKIPQGHTDYPCNYEVFWENKPIGKLAWSALGRGTNTYSWYDRFCCMNYAIPGRGYNMNNFCYRFPHWMVDEMPALFTKSAGPVWKMDAKLSNTIFYHGDEELGPLGPRSKMPCSKMSFSLRDARALIRGVMEGWDKKRERFPGFSIYREGPVNMARYIDSLLELHKFEREARKGTAERTENDTRG